MAILDYSFGTLSIPNTWQPCHVKEIVEYLKYCGYDFELYKEFHTSKYILIRDNITVYYKKCSEICEDLLDLYFKEKHEEEVKYFENRKKKELKNKNFKKEVLLKWKN